jgi:hypothetical protein
MGQRPCGTLNTFDSLCRDELGMFWGQMGVQLNIRKVFLMFSTLRISEKMVWLVWVDYFILLNNLCSMINACMYIMYF